MKDRFTRQVNVQFHDVKAEHVGETVARTAQSGRTTQGTSARRRDPPRAQAMPSSKRPLRSSEESRPTSAVRSTTAISSP